MKKSWQCNWVKLQFSYWICNHFAGKSEIYWTVRLDHLWQRFFSHLWLKAKRFKVEGVRRVHHWRIEHLISWIRRARLCNQSKFSTKQMPEWINGVFFFVLFFFSTPCFDMWVCVVWVRKCSWVHPKLRGCQCFCDFICHPSCCFLSLSARLCSCVLTSTINWLWFTFGACVTPEEEKVSSLINREIRGASVAAVVCPAGAYLLIGRPLLFGRTSH